MPRTDLDDATERLLKYNQLSSLQDLAETTLLASTTPGASQDDAENINLLLDQFTEILVNTQRGSLTSNNLVLELIRLNRGFEELGGNPLAQQIVNWTFERAVNPETDRAGVTEILGLSNESGNGINSKIGNPTKNTPTLSIFQVNNSRISQTNKNGNAIAIFMNAIPTTEWAMSVPFLEVLIQYNRAPVTSDGRISTLSIHKFLEGSAKVNPETTDFKMQMASTKDEVFDIGTADDNGIRGGQAGMEMFLMPQTLQNPDASSDDLRANPVIDRFRPLMSITGFEVDVVPAAGVMSYRTARLNITLHDKSRMTEIADFIKADLYSKTEMLIEYGWEHPNKSGDNVYADFINALRVKEKYKVKNYSMNMKSNGEVDIVLDLFTTGGVDSYVAKISTDANRSEKQEEIQQLQQTIAHLRSEVFKSDQKFFKEIRGQQILNTASDTNADLTLTRSLRRELRMILKQLDRSPSKSAKELYKNLKELFGDDGQSGKVRELGSTIASAIDQKMKIIGPSKNTRTPDPFLPLFITRKSDVPNDTTIAQIEKGEKSEQFVSLAKLMLLFVGQPMAEQNKFDDVQFIYYTFNDHAGLARGANIGAFPIQITEFKKRFTKLATQRRTANFSVREFIGFLINGYLDDMSNPIYGMRDLYTYDPDSETGKRNIPAVRSDRKNPAVFFGKIEERMKAIGVPDGKFKLPKVDVYLEAVPAVPLVEGGSKKTEENKTIIRLHVFDVNASAYESQAEFLDAQRDEVIRTLGQEGSKINKNDVANKKDTLVKLIQKAQKEGLIERIEPTAAVTTDTQSKVYKTKGSISDLKKFISRTMPYAIYGANGTSIIDGGFETMKDEKLSTINMINAGDTGDITPHGSAVNGLPIRVFPAQANLRTYGCPIIEYTQSLFIDYQTGTTIDNIYAAIKIQHSINPGKFVTSVNYSPFGDSYGQYRSLLDTMDASIKVLAELAGQDDPDTADVTPAGING